MLTSLISCKCLISVLPKNDLFLSWLDFDSSSRALFIKAWTFGLFWKKPLF